MAMNASQMSPSSSIARSSSTLPTLLFVHGAEQRELVLTPLPFGIGRKTGKDLEIPDPRISRDHADIILEGADYFVVDPGSKLGTFVNGERITKKKLVPNDRIEFANLAFTLLKEDNRS